MRKRTVGNLGLNRSPMTNDNTRSKEVANPQPATTVLWTMNSSVAHVSNKTRLGPRYNNIAMDANLNGKPFSTQARYKTM
eukprot:5062653-Karenia_brevis.AAC.1